MEVNTQTSITLQVTMTDWQDKTFMEARFPIANYLQMHLEYVFAAKLSQILAEKPALINNGALPKQ